MIVPAMFLHTIILFMLLVKMASITLTTSRKQELGCTERFSVSYFLA